MVCNYPNNVLSARGTNLDPLPSPVKTGDPLLQSGVPDSIPGQSAQELSGPQYPIDNQTAPKSDRQDGQDYSRKDSNRLLDQIQRHRNLYATSHAGYFSYNYETRDQIKHMDTYTHFLDQSIRQSFVKKVYFVMMFQLLITTSIVTTFVFYHPIKIWVRKNWNVYVFAYLLFFGLVILFFCCGHVRRKFPLNYICLLLFTLAMSYLTGVISSYHDTITVLVALGITACLCSCISLLAAVTPVDFTKCSAFLVFTGITFIFFGIACSIVFAISGRSKILQTVFGGFGVTLFSLYLCYNTQMILGGRSHHLSEEDYIIGALELFMDVTQIYLMILAFTKCQGD